MSAPPHPEFVMDMLMLAFIVSAIGLGLLIAEELATALRKLLRERRMRRDRERQSRCSHDHWVTDDSTLISWQCKKCEAMGLYRDGRFSP